MDTISTLDTAACILHATSFIETTFAVEQSYKVQAPYDNGEAILRSLKTFRLALSDTQGRLATSFTRSEDALPLRDLVSSRDAAIVLLESIEDVFTRSTDKPTGRTGQIATEALLRLKLEESARLKSNVTREIAHVHSSQISQFSQSLTMLESQNRYARPEHESQVDLMSRDLEHLRIQAQKHLSNPDATYTQADIEQLRVLLVRLAEAEDALLADTIVASLNYTSRPIRLDSIPQAHQDTFQWAFDSRLANWFLSGSGTFWISGKPGSGKSTFMKFISKHTRTKELLEIWAGPTGTLAIATHCFWIAGTPIQKSWQGLLQSLLHDLLRGHPQAVSIACPSRWAAAKVGKWQAAAEPWSVEELAVALRALSTAKQMPLRMCLFIDGLDEYDSNHAELCQVLLDMAKSPHVKICLSSRRWPVFERSFGQRGQESLDIHELTRDDIRKFVNDQLQADLRWTAETSEGVTLAKAELVDRIVTQADGVFLWAFFVTRSLREGLANGEKIEDLARRFSQLPSDLDHLFQHMLDSVDPTDHSTMAGILQGASVALRREQTVRSINQKTKGLLKLVYDRFEFLHRTVKDFVSTKDVGDYLRSKLPSDYNGFTSIAGAYLGYLRGTRQKSSLVVDVIRQGRGMNSGPLISHLNQALFYASEALKQAEQPGSTQRQQVEKLLDEYEAAIVEMVSLGHVTVRGVNSDRLDARLLFREELLRHELSPYLTKKIAEQPNFFDVFDESPLFAALMPMSRDGGESPGPSSEVLDILLGRGEDPNLLPRQLDVPSALDAPSPWVLFARSTMSVFNMLSGPCMFPALRWNDSLKNATFSRLLSHGANPNQPLLDRPAARTVFSHFLDIALSKFLGEECFEDYLRTLDSFLRAGASLV
ncbi:Vegetative incompatibility protein HET-E-1 [Colletotrichum siamense]|uniref:Vegetative incompatibility protein HET-E-1 n=1 Tax=Colletotrichum siamense TaxID=690259 RepID=UPI00187339D8|nr:Vegetative incompatibility protein HET-E-1 [Colletotrichum siamense]KAF5500096.1 Vegetative incompatibility protein HET-E-1 [Colletotrichum siamense]